MKRYFDYLLWAVLAGFFLFFINARFLMKGIEVEVLGEEVNSEFDEFAPIVSYDGTKIYFHRGSHPGNVGGIDDPSDIWVADISPDGTFSSAVNIGEPINSTDGNTLFSVLPDGNTIMTNLQKGPTTIPAILYRNTNSWTTPRMQAFLKNAIEGREATFTLSPNGLVMLISMETKKGDKDLYISFREADNTWSKPENMGNTVNSDGDEINPFIAADGQTVYFSSNGLNTYGETDVFMTRVQDNNYKMWTQPRNLGSKINSKGEDNHFTVSASGEFGYFVSRDKNSMSLDLVRIPLSKVFAPAPVDWVDGSVTNAIDGSGIDALIEYSLEDGTLAGSAHSESTKGAFGLVLPEGRTYTILAKKPGYYSKPITVQTTTDKTLSELTANVELIPLKGHGPIEIEGVSFRSGSAEINESSFAGLDLLADFLVENPTQRIELILQPEHKVDFLLHKEQLEVVKSYLIEHGANEESIAVQDYILESEKYPADTENWTSSTLGIIGGSW